MSRRATPAGEASSRSFLFFVEEFQGFRLELANNTYREPEPMIRRAAMLKTFFHCSGVCWKISRRDKELTD